MQWLPLDVSTWEVFVRWSPSRRDSVQGVSVKGVLCPGASLSRGLWLEVGGLCLPTPVNRQTLLKTLHTLAAGNKYNTPIITQSIKLLRGAHTERQRQRQCQPEHQILGMDLGPILERHNAFQRTCLMLPLTLTLTLPLPLTLDARCGYTLKESCCLRLFLSSDMHITTTTGNHFFGKCLLRLKWRFLSVAIRT